MREWLSRLERLLDADHRGLFRQARPQAVPLSVSAARAIQCRLRRLGFDVVKPISFTVTDTPGPLAQGELERARDWGASPVPATVATTGPPR